MYSKLVPFASAAVLALAACTAASVDEAPPGAVLPVEQSDPVGTLYSPEDRTAMALGLPDQVAGMALFRSPAQVIADDEDRFAMSSRVRPILVELGLSPDRVSIEQKGSTHTEIPAIGLAAIQTTGVPAERFTLWDPTFYMLLTSVDTEQYQWLGEKPGRQQAVVAERAVWLADFERFRVAWYAKGDVLYVVLAGNDQLLEAAVRAMPEPESIAEA